MNRAAICWIISLWSGETPWVQNKCVGLKCCTFFIHKDNNDIAHPWSVAWYLRWLNARAFALTFAPLSQPQVSPSFIATDGSTLKGNPPAPVRPVSAEMHSSGLACMLIEKKTHSLASIVHASLIGCAECMTPADRNQLWLAESRRLSRIHVLLRFSAVATICIQQNHRHAYICSLAWQSHEYENADNMNISSYQTAFFLFIASK